MSAWRTTFSETSAHLRRVADTGIPTSSSIQPASSLATSSTCTPASSSEAIDAAILGDLNLAVGDEHVRALVNLILLQLLALGSGSSCCGVGHGFRGGQAPWQKGPSLGNKSADPRSLGRVRAGFEVCAHKRPQQE